MKNSRLDPYGDPEDADEYIGDNIFFVPKESRWKLIADSALTAEIGIVIDKAMEAIEKDNAHLKGILPKIMLVRNLTKGD